MIDRVSRGAVTAAALSNDERDNHDACSTISACASGSSESRTAIGDLARAANTSADVFIHQVEQFVVHGLRFFFTTTDRFRSAVA